MPINVELVKIEPVAKNVKTFWFKPEKKIDYTPGQFTEIKLPHVNEDDRGDKRWFTLFSSPTEEMLAITTKFADKGSSFKRALLELKLGAKLQLADPMGDFVLPKDKAIPLVFIAGGMGVTPFRSIIKWLSDTGEKRSVELLLAFNKPEDVIFEDLFSGYSPRVTTIISQPPTSWTGESGHLSAERIMSLIEGAKNKRLYISGPEPMVETLEEQLKDAGIQPNNLVLDFFPGYRPI